MSPGSDGGAGGGVLDPAWKQNLPSRCAHTVHSVGGGRGWTPHRCMRQGPPS